MLKMYLFDYQVDLNSGYHTDARYTQSVCQCFRTMLSSKIEKNIFKLRRFLILISGKSISEPNLT